MSEWVQFSYRDARGASECRSWSADDDIRLRAHWDEGLSAAQIGMRIGRSKNSVVGRAHRLDLPARPSPLVSVGTKKGPRRRLPFNRGPVTLPLLSAPDELEGLATFARKAPPRPVVVPPPATPIDQAPGVIRPCVFPLWGDNTPKSQRRFCEAASLPGKPYCSVHAAVCYKSRADLRDAA